MITQKNYFEQLKSIDYKSLPEALKEGFDTIKMGSKDYTTWQYLEDDPDFLKLYFKKLNEHLDKQDKKPVKKTTAPKKKKATTIKKAIVKRAQSKKSTVDYSLYNMVEKTPLEVRFIKRYINLHDNTKTQKEILSFIKTLQKAIAEKEIEKTSKYAKEIIQIQEDLVTAYNIIKAGKKQIAKFTLQEKYLKAYTVIVERYMVSPSVSYIKRFINLYSDPTKAKAKRLLTIVINGLENGKVQKSDKYHKEVQYIKRTLANYVEMDKAIRIKESELHGLMGIAGCCFKSLSNTDLSGTDNSSDEALSGVDLLNMHFETMGFTGKWKTLIGNPTKVFHMMIWGGEGSGKTTLAVEFANYLASLGEKINYLAGEQRYSATLQDIIRRMNATHPNLKFSEYFQEDYSGFDFVFIDSVNFNDLSYEDLIKLQEDNPNTCFIYIFQALKDGSRFRGDRRFAHLVDVVIKVESLSQGNSIAMIDCKNRFGGNGEVEVEFRV